MFQRDTLVKRTIMKKCAALDSLSMWAYNK